MHESTQGSYYVNPALNRFTDEGGALMHGTRHGSKGESAERYAVIVVPALPRTASRALPREVIRTRPSFTFSR